MRYRILGETGLRVSSLALGAGNFGKGWGYGSDKDEAYRIYATFRDRGGNFLDTADQYQFGDSETMLGTFMAGHRDEVVLATKFSLGDAPGAGLHRTGNSRKAMRTSVEASLTRLQTDYIDLLWVHMPDGVTPIEEIARGLDDMVRSGKVLHVGLSDFPAWRVATASTLADARGWAPVSAVQLEYSLVERSVERELLPMANAFNLGVLGWSPLGGGLLTGKYRRGEHGRAQGLGVVIHSEESARETAVVDELLAVAEAVGAAPGQVAIAWVLAKGVLPIIGSRTHDQLLENLGSLDLRLAEDHLARLDTASAISLGFPHDLVARSASVLAGGKPDLVDPAARPVR